MSALGVEEFCNVSPCRDGVRPKWDGPVMFNDCGLYDTPEEAMMSVAGRPESFELYAYGVLPCQFLGNSVEPLVIRPACLGSLPAEFVRIGFDVANRTFTPFFECSPLSCNMLAAEVAARVNQHCLLVAAEDAVAFAKRCAREEPAPGPFFVLEVLRAGAR